MLKFVEGHRIFCSIFLYCLVALSSLFLTFKLTIFIIFLTWFLGDFYLSWVTKNYSGIKFISIKYIIIEYIAASVAIAPDPSGRTISTPPAS